MSAHILQLGTCAFFITAYFSDKKNKYDIVYINGSTYIWSVISQLITKNHEPIQKIPIHHCTVFIYRM